MAAMEAVSELGLNAEVANPTIRFPALILKWFNVHFRLKQLECFHLQANGNVTYEMHTTNE